MLSPSGAVEDGARIDSGAVIVDTPFGGYRYERVRLTAGWYKLKSSSPVSIRLWANDRLWVADLEAESNRDAIIKLSANYYDIRVTFALRPGIYNPERSTFSRLSLLRVAIILADRLKQALSKRISMQHLTSLVKLSMSKSSFGVATHSVNLLGGVLDRSDTTLPTRSNANARLNALKDWPIFLVVGITQDYELPTLLGEQIYKNYTYNKSDDFDYKLVLSRDDILFPDALLLLAEYVSRFDWPDRIIADKRIGNRRTAWVAWDPFLYSQEIPTPHVKRKNSPVDVSREKSAILPVPVARSTSTSTSTSKYTLQENGNNLGQATSNSCSIIIPTRDRADLLSACLSGLFSNTHWPHEVIVVDNGSVEEKTQSLFKLYRSKGLRVIEAPMSFNFSALCNIGAEAAKHEFLLFLNNDTVLHDPKWLGEMMQYATIDTVGAVGAKLLYRDQRLQHGGIAFGFSEICGHPWRGLSHSNQQHEPQLSRTSLRSAVTGACLALKKSKFNAVGGFDEALFPVTLNDVDLCLKLAQKGWHTVFAAEAELYHLEGESRGGDFDAAKTKRRLKELKRFYTKWPESFSPDPFYSDALQRREIKVFR